jgi:hypothetical protein
MVVAMSKIKNNENASKVLAILIAMQMCQYNVGG